MEAEGRRRQRSQSPEDQPPQRIPRIEEPDSDSSDVNYGTLLENATRAMQAFIATTAVHNQNMGLAIVAYVPIFINKLLIEENGIINRDLALVYILELEKAGIEPATIARLRAKASTLPNTTVQERDLAVNIYMLASIDRTIQLPLIYVKYYIKKLQDAFLPRDIIDQLAHNLRLFLFALFVTSTYNRLDKYYATEYITEITPYLPVSVGRTLQDVIPRLEKVQDLEYLPSAMLMASAANAIIKNTPLTEDDMNDISDLYVSVPTNQRLERALNTSLDQYSRALSWYFRKAPENVFLVVQNASDFINVALARENLNKRLGGMFINALVNYFTPLAITFLTAYIDGPYNQGQPATLEFVQDVNKAIMYDQIIRAFEMVKEDMRRRRRVPLASKSSPKMSPITDSPPGDILLPEVSAEFKSFVTRLLKFQRKYNAPCTDQSLTEIKLKLIYAKEDYLLPKAAVIHNVDPEQCLAAAFKYWVSQPEREQVRFSLRDLNDYTQFDITYLNSEGIGIGVTRDFFQRCILELKRDAVFISAGLSDEPVDRWVLNPRFRPTQAFKQITGLDFNTLPEFADFHKFIGRLLCLILLNDIGLPFNVSHSILYAMVTGKPVSEPVDIIGCDMLDKPNEYIGKINLMKTPAVIESLDLEYEIEQPLPTPLRGGPMPDTYYKTIQVTDATYLDYLTYEAKKSLNFSMNRLVSGFHPISKMLRKEKVSLYMLDKLITFDAVTMETVDKLIAFLENKTTEREAALRAEAARVEAGEEPSAHPPKPLPAAHTTLLQILQDKGKHYPKDGSRSASPVSKEKRFLGFVEKLLYFWTGLKHFNPAFRYTVAEIGSGRESGSGKRLPEAHTCYTQLDIPKAYGGKFDVMYGKLVQAVEEVEVGVGRY